MSASHAIWTTKEWNDLVTEAEKIESTHLRDLIQDKERCSNLVVEHGPMVMDYARQRVTQGTMDKLFALAKAAKLEDKIKDMASGKHINVTEDRAVMHMALRAPRGKTMEVDGTNVVPEVWDVLDRIAKFTSKVRSGEWKGVTDQPIKNVISVGIGGSYLGPEFVYEALRTDGTASSAAAGRKLRFLANVDPVDVARSYENLNPENTIVVIVSKTFTTAETMLNAKSLKKWLVDSLKGSGASENDIVAKHMVAVSAAVPKAQEFGILSDNVFGFWDWVGGRYSVCSAVGALPLSLHYGFEIFEKFLQGAADMDEHFTSTSLNHNLPVLLGLLGVWNSSFLKYNSRALLPYSQALIRFAAHIQQVDMESNGKRVTVDGEVLPFDAGEINFGEPGTNGQHSFYQLMHQGQVVPADFIGFIHGQVGAMPNNPVSNHDELMSNFFAQPDALACGKTEDDLINEGVPTELRPHKLFPGNRPSTVLLFPHLDAFTCGQLLALYEHRTAVQGFVWNVPSFDQWGVELGKQLATQVRSTFKTARLGTGVKALEETKYNPSTKNLLHKYIGASTSS